ncbi:Asparagine synthetase [glutamine-hydrolyzing] [Strongyloides ratti]|uniref:Asparagine synthetase [glutamine-hydrolyzing] n=1 Tax=Strongyloides ratti TaxID=34506 RepID=A0A090L550_STRRB|nr:Asparagine synthetase [glutamine-hydrolyzing] [Strongyloides ratti]CEF63202.1 Asparagine synthetase [glutamine-hydrolyzing] [Strongyloides ratti]
MCGIWALIGKEYCNEKHGKEFMKIVGRGPDYTIVKQVQKNAWLGFHRLAIVIPGDVPSQQPIVSGNLSVVCNGEIYNHFSIKASYQIDSNNILNGGSDCAAIIHSFLLNNRNIVKTCESLDGVFAFVMADEDNLYVGRDALGVRPLFYGHTIEGDIIFGSEVKCIEKLVEKVEFFPPGCCAEIPLKKNQFSQKHTMNLQQFFNVPIKPHKSFDMIEAQTLVREVLVQSVEKRLMGNKKFGFMLSGGLDSSLIAAIASKYLTHQKPIAFSVGFEDSPDLENARKVAEFLNIPHEILVITPEDCINIIPDVVYALETYDPLIIRCGIAHYLLCKYISTKSDVRVLLSGEGADELFGSYAYMQRAPNSSHLHREILRRLKHLHQYDVLRCDRSTSCHGLEIRVPFLDKKFIKLTSKLPPTMKLIKDQLEKYVLRSAFEGWLPDEVLWRSKEGFAEALGKIDLGDIINEHTNKIISDTEYNLRFKLFPHNTPESKEEMWYRGIFEECYSIGKMTDVVHTKVYKTAAWHIVDEKENCKDRLMVFCGSSSLRRKSTGSATFSGVA